MVTQPEFLEAYDEDRALVCAFQAGDDQKFSEIVRSHYPALLARARRRLGNTSDAEDAVQETFLRAYLALDRFAGEFRLTAWLYRILDNTCADAGTKRAGEQKLRERLAGRREALGTLDEHTADPRLRLLIRQAITSLPESYRVAFVMREIEEKPYSEVAESMAVTEENARARVHRARISLARTLRDASASFGALAVPLRLAFGRRHHGGGAPASLGAWGPTPVPQALGQLSASPPSLLASFLDVSRDALPLASSALVTLAAGAAAVLPAALGSPVAPTPVSALPTGPLGLGPLTQVTDLTATTPTTVTSTPTATVGPEAPAATRRSGSTTASTTSGPPSSPAAADPTPALLGSPDQWSWVAAAATGTGSSGSASASPSPSSSSVAACPYAQSFPIYTPGAVPLVAPMTAGASPTGSLVTNPVEVSNPGDAYETDGTGQASDGATTGTVQASTGTCGGGDYPMLVANLAGSSTGSSPAPILQIEAALVSTSSSAAGTDSYFRGVGVWLTGPDRTAVSVPLVAEVASAPTGDATTHSADRAVNLLVAFYGPVTDIVDPGGSTCPAPSSGSGSSSTTSTAPPGPSGSAADPGSACATADATDPSSSPTTDPASSGSGASGSS